MFGFAVLNLGKLAFPYIEQNVDEFVVVREDYIALTIALLAERAMMIAEGVDAATFTALLTRRFEV